MRASSHCRVLRLCACVLASPFLRLKAVALGKARLKPRHPRRSEEEAEVKRGKYEHVNELVLGHTLVLLGC